MKKFFPIIIFVMAFAGLMVFHIVFDSFDTSAKLSSGEQNRNIHLENTFKKISFKTLDKKKWNLSEQKAPVTIINFWASWCRPCLAEFPSLIKLRERYSEDKLMIFGINGDEEEQLKKIHKIKKTYSLNFPNVLDKDSKIHNEFLVQAIPFTVIFHKGKVFQTSKGAKNFYDPKFLAKIDELVK